jgi:RNA polymerase sigma factor (sigma-70 family)
MPRRFYFRLLSSAVPVGDHVPDRELLRRFDREQDAAAFELLLRRHADAVWTVCCRVLGAGPDAEDVFQATFLLLVRKAAGVRNPSVGGWLYRVAVNAALKLRQQSDRFATATSEQLAVVPAPVADEPDLELSAIVQEELARLPERYRLPIVLCELEGHTHAEAAQALGWPVGSVAGRVSRARTLLRDRLARRGVSAPAIMLPSLGVSPALVRDVTAIVVGAVPVPLPVSTLIEGALSMMRLAKYKLIAMGLLSVVVVAVTGFGTYTALGQRPVAPGAETTSAPDRPGPEKPAEHYSIGRFDHSVPGTRSEKPRRPGDDVPKDPGFQGNPPPPN